MMMNKIVIESNIRWIYHNNYDNIMKNKKNLKIYLANDNNERYMNKYNNLLYNCGWFREGFLQLIMDDSHRIDVVVDDNNAQLQSHQSSLSQPLLELMKLLELQSSHPKTNQFHLDIPVNIDKNKYNIFDLSLNNMSHIGMNILTLIQLFKNEKYYLDELNDHCVECVVNKCTNSVIWCLIDPVKIILEEPRVLNVELESGTMYDHLYIQKNHFLDGHCVRLKHAGALFIYTKNNILYGKWLKGSKKKKVKNILEWTISSDQNMYWSLTKYGAIDNNADNETDQLIILSSNHVNHANKILKINSDFFVRDSDKKRLIKIKKSFDIILQSVWT